MSWDHNCNHLRMARIFTRCPLCKQPLNSTQAVANDHHGHATPAVASIPFHTSGDTE